MTATLRKAAIIGGSRIPFARSNTAYVDLTNLDMLTAAMQALVDNYRLRGVRLGEVAAGAVIKHTRDAGLARQATLGSGLHPHTPAYDIQRACGTSLTATVQLAQRIALGEIDSGIAGGVDSASDIPITYGRKLQQAVLEGARGRDLGGRIKPWLGPATARPEARSTRHHRAEHRVVDGRALRTDGQGMGHRPARTG